LTGKYDPYDSGLAMDIFIKDESGRPFVGKVWNPVSTVWPDFSHPNISSYWLNQLEGFRKKVPFDGAWIVSYLIVTFSVRGLLEMLLKI
jgi:lysosomal alpha-glucosidase